MEKRLDIDIEQIIDDLKAATHEIKRLEDSGNIIGAVQLRLTQIEQKDILIRELQNKIENLISENKELKEFESPYQIKKRRSERRCLFILFVLVFNSNLCKKAGIKTRAKKRF